MRYMIASTWMVASLSLFGRTTSDVAKDISALNNEFTQLQKNPIVILGSKQEGLSEDQKKATSTYNVNIAQGKERARYKTKKVITVNPTYVCPIHKVLFITDSCPSAFSCKAEKSIGTKNFAGMGSDYDLSYRTWKLLKAKIPEGETQEARLREIETEISALREEMKALKNEESKKAAEKYAKPGKKK